jgi:ABC-type transport system substrate-binding protein
LNEVFNPNTAENWIGWDNQEFASLMEQAMQTSDQKERQTFYTRAEEILCKEEAAILPLYYDVAPILVNPRVKGWYYMPINGQHIRKWSLEK